MPVTRLIKLSVAAAIVALAWWLALSEARRTLSDQRSTEAALARDTIEAAADTTRALYHIDVNALGDSLQVVQRRAVQAEQKADELDRALGQERVVRDRLLARVAGLSRIVRSETVFVERPAGGDGVRRAEFRVREAPYTVAAAVALPPPSGQGTMGVKVELDTLRLELRVGCGPANEFGVRAATTSVVAPAWAAVRLDRIEQLASVCARASPERLSGFATGLRRVIDRVGISAGYAALRQPAGDVVAGPALMIGLRVWP
jgi:hypothetical protein